MWLTSARTAIALFCTVAGVVALRGLTDLSPAVSLLVGAPVGWLVGTLLLGRVADRLDASLHRMGGPRRR